MEKVPLKTEKKVTKMGENWKKISHPTTVQCITRIYRYLGAHVMHYNKNKSHIKTLNIL